MTVWLILAGWLVLVVTLGLMGVGWAVARLIRGWEERNRQSFFEPPRRRRAPESDEERAALDVEMLRYIHAARGTDQHMVDAWREEKLAEGWDADDVDTFLRSRKPLELM